MKCLQAPQKELDEECDSAAKLVSEGNKRLVLALANKNMDEVTIASALIDSANKKMDALKEKGDALSLKRK